MKHLKKRPPLLRPILGLLAANSLVFAVSSTPPTVRIDLPTPGSVVSGTVTVSGWAIENASVVGKAIRSVQVKVDGKAVSNATYGGSRPDVCKVYPGRAGCPNVGFTYQLDTTKFTPGAHTITVLATATDPTQDAGSSTVTVTVTVAPTPPTVRIDLPTPGSTVSGTVTVSGWAIDNASVVGKAIRSVQVKVDGKAVGDTTYGVNRPDVCKLYPRRPGCPNVGFTYQLDTTKFTQGPHMITVSATDTHPTPDVGSSSVTVNVSH
jgi:Big-like domain-containing protein